MLSFRPVTDADYEYLYRLHEASMRCYVEQAYGPWDEALQRRIFAERWRPDRVRIVQVDGEDAGALELIPGPSRVQIEGIRLMPACQRRGIGTQIVSDVLRDAHMRGQVVTLRVLKVNPARRLYERLGFVVVGENGPSWLMECRPPA
jgi:ribosomal protein S18 acetylase RimI-like enzyme